MFNESWVTDKKYSPWMMRSTKWRAYCSFCLEDFGISNMGCSALTGHASGKKYSEIPGLKSLSVGNTFFDCLDSSETSVKPTSNLQAVENMVVPVSRLWAEVVWVLKVLKNSFSLCQ